jgi:archaetidylinositol phosphate synthase
MSDKQFGGDKKMPMRTFLAKWERRFIDALVPKFPQWIHGYHLTLMTILWSAGLIAFGYLARGNLSWLWLSSLMLMLQWFTDCFDGALGKFRDTGIPKWGYYMDHLLDFVFLCSILIGYSFLRRR